MLKLFRTEIVPLLVITNFYNKIGFSFKKTYFIRFKQNIGLEVAFVLCKNLI